MPLGEPMTAPADLGLTASLAGNALDNALPDADEGDAIAGTVKWFDVKKGFGFIVGPNGQDVFVHFSTIRCDGFRTLKDGEHVRYELHRGDKGYHAKNVCRIEAAAKGAESSPEKPAAESAPKKAGKDRDGQAAARSASRPRVEADDLPPITAADRPRRRPALDGYVG